jgi:hypothetical protein
MRIHIDHLCSACNGSGEGYADGTTCRTCRGAGGSSLTLSGTDEIVAYAYENDLHGPDLYDLGADPTDPDIAEYLAERYGELPNGEEGDWD